MNPQCRQPSADSLPRQLLPVRRPLISLSLSRSRPAPLNISAKQSRQLRRHLRILLVNVVLLLRINRKIIQLISRQPPIQSLFALRRASPTRTRTKLDLPPSSANRKPPTARMTHYRLRILPLESVQHPGDITHPFSPPLYEPDKMILSHTSQTFKYLRAARQLGGS